MSDCLMFEEEDYEVEYYYDMTFSTEKEAYNVCVKMEPKFAKEIKKFGLKPEECEFFHDEYKMIVVQTGNQTLQEEFFQKIADQYNVEFTVNSSRFINGEGGIYDESSYKSGGNDD